MVKKWLSIGVVLVALAVVGGIVYQNVSSPPVGVNQGEQAPDFDLPQQNGENISLSDFDENFVIVNLWASWCEPCIREFPVLDDAHQNYEDEGVHVIAVNMATTERSPDEALAFLEENPVSMPIVFDEDGEFADDYPLRDGLPQTYFINEEGIIVDVHRGELTEEMLDERIQPFL
ncbi:TlpA family protein disulfide reductase [Natribacillus halophilus]|uniref:Peroxiredoxin n=1 Tax=Natribacillus halophilus TaxID=549003 RepID=A0A1G8JH40_9BACI|nr:TlpA disulfide reductase family protein [Natribacillus halophilus]SDI30594.1 Peroxiredoxin [Natribacillus halophilus]